MDMTSNPRAAAVAPHVLMKIWIKYVIVAILYVAQKLTARAISRVRLFAVQERRV